MCYTAPEAWLQGERVGSEACMNCGAALAGAYCAACGQRRFVESDRRFGHLLGEFFSAATDLDGRFWRSMRALLFSPGRIAGDYIAGARIRWMSPISLFLLANLMFFLAPALTDLTLPLRNQVPPGVLEPFVDPSEETTIRGGGQFHSAFTARLAYALIARDRERATAAGRAWSLEEYERRYASRTEAIGKLLVIVHVPFVALALMPTTHRARRRWYFAEHFVFALTLVAFVLLFMQVLALPAAWVYMHLLAWFGAPPAGMPAAAKLGLLAIVLVYFTMACRRAYGGGWIAATARGVLAFAMLACSSLVVYRGVQLLLTLWLA